MLLRPEPVLHALRPMQIPQTPSHTGHKVLRASPTASPVHLAAVTKPAIAMQASPASTPDSASSRSAATTNRDALAALSTIGHLLQNRDVLKKKVIECFRKTATGDDGLAEVGLRLLGQSLASSTNLPAKVFSGLELEITRFDFSGSGQLYLNEVYKLVKHHMREWQKHYEGSYSTNLNIRWQALGGSGYSVTRELGKGSQATVMLAKDRAGKEVCVKCYSKEKMDLSAVDELKDEFATMQELACQYIAQAFEIFQDQTHYYMVGEAYHGGDMTTLKARASSQGVNMNQDWWRGIFRQCFKALDWMHGQAMMHCDIKEANIMLKTSNFHSPEVVLIDFGVSRAMVGAVDKIVGTPGFIPPETYESNGRWFPRGDLFSMGVSLLQVFIDKVAPTGSRTLKTPGGIFIEGCATIEDIARATREREPPFHLISKEYAPLAALFRKLLAKNMSQRPSAPQVLEDAWFGGAVQDARSRPRRGSGGGMELPESRRKNSFRSRGRFASLGITRSFLATMDDDDSEDSDVPPAVRALKELQRQLGVDKPPSEAQSDNRSPSSSIELSNQFQPQPSPRVTQTASPGSSVELSNQFQPQPSPRVTQTPPPSQHSTSQVTPQAVGRRRSAPSPVRASCLSPRPALRSHAVPVAKKSSPMPTSPDHAGRMLVHTPSVMINARRSVVGQ